MQPDSDDQEHRTDADKCEEGNTEVYAETTTYAVKIRKEDREAARSR